MGHTIWVDVRDRSNEEDDREDCSIMLRLEAHLDRLCTTLNVRKLSDFYDYSELIEAYGGFDDASESTPLETGQPQGAWFDSVPALGAIRALREHFNRHPNDLGFEPDDSRQHWPAQLKEELKHCECLLEKAVAKARQFRFLVVS